MLYVIISSIMNTLSGVTSSIYNTFDYIYFRISIHMYDDIDLSDSGLKRWWTQTYGY